MINCKKHLITAGFILAFPLAVWSEAPVVDESDNFAIIDGRQAREMPVDPRYDDQQALAQNDNYPVDSYDDEGPALAKDDQMSGASNSTASSASLIDKIQSLQKEVQELRGQLEVQAHDLKLLQQQQLAFYKDLDARLSGNTTAKAAPAKPSMDLSVGAKESAPKVTAPAPQPVATKPATPAVAPVAVTAASHANPADEQISYLAAYELIKNKQYDEAVNSMSVFVQKYPKGGYTANAQYWLGELYLAKKDYAKSIEHFNVVLQQFPTSSKSAASMLKVGYAYAAMGNKSEARKYLQQVERAYPNTPTAQLANSKLRTI